MTKRNKTDLQSRYTTLLPDNTSGDISPQDMRDCFTDTSDSLVFWDDTAPSSVSDTCTKVEVVVAGSDPYFLYVCVATNTWRRSELAPF